MTYELYLKEISNKVTRRRAEKDMLLKSLNRIDSQILESCQKEVHLQEESELLKLVSRTSKEYVKTVIENVVTEGLRSIFFDRDFRFTIKIKEERKVASAEFNLEERVKKEWKIRDFKSVGGGVIDVVSVLLRISGLVLRRPPQRKILFLDEPFKHMAKEYLPKASAFLSKVTKELGMQIILTTHSEIVAEYADSVWKASLKEGNICELTEVENEQTRIQIRG